MMRAMKVPGMFEQIPLIQLTVVPFSFKTGEQMGGADLKIHSKMDDQASVTRQPMRMGKARAVPQVANAETVMRTANVMHALTSEKLLQVVV